MDLLGPDIFSTLWMKVVYSTSRQSGWGSLWLVLLLVSDFSIIWEEVMSPWRSYSSRDFVEYIIKFLSPFFPSFVRIFTFSYSLVLSVDIQRTSALIEVMFWSQIVLIGRRSRTQLLLHLGRRNWLENWWYWCIAQGTIYNLLKLMKFLCFSSMTWINCDWLFLCC